MENMELIKVRDKYHQKLKFLESRDNLSINHVKVLIKGLTGLKTFIYDSNELFEPIAIEWLNVYCECRHKLDEELFISLVYYASSTIIKILIMEHKSLSFVNDFAYRFFELINHVPGYILGRFFITHLPVFKMLANKIFDCVAYSNQVTLLEILFRFVNEYRSYQFENGQRNTPDLVSDDLFPSIRNKSDLIDIFLNMRKSSFDMDSRNFLNKLNGSVEPRVIFSIVAESIKFNERNLTPPVHTNQTYVFWIDFNISMVQISFSCKGEGNENDWVANLIAKEDLERLVIESNDLYLNLSVYLKRVMDLSASMPKFDSNFKIDFTFELNRDSRYLEQTVLPHFQSYLNAKNVDRNEMPPTKQQIAKPKHCQKLLTSETIERINKYDTIVEEQEAEEHQLQSKIIKYTNQPINSFTFEQSFSKSCASFNFNIFKDLAPNPEFQSQQPQIETSKPAHNARVLSNITNKMATKNPTPEKRKPKPTTSMIKDSSRTKNPTPEKRKPKPTTSVIKDSSRTENISDFDQIKSDGKTNTSNKRKLYSKKVIENDGMKGSQSSKENIKPSSRAKPRKTKKLINRVVPLQTDVAKNTKSNVRNSDYTNSEILTIQANVEIINSGIHNSVETTENEIMVSNVSLRESGQSITNHSPYDLSNIRLVETRDDAFVSNIISQVRSQQKAASQVVQQNLIPVHTSTPLVNVANKAKKATKKPIDNKNVSNSYRRFAKSKDTTKLGYNTIESYNENSFNIAPEQPLRVQGYRQSKSKIKNLYERDSSSDDDVGNLRDVDPNSNCATNTTLDQVGKQTEIDERQQPSNVIINETRVSTGIDILSSKDNVNEVCNEPPIEVRVVVKENPQNKTVKQFEKQSDEPLIPNVPAKKVPIIKQIDKPREVANPVISIPMPIVIDEIKTENIISVDDDSNSENIDWNPYSATQVNADLPTIYSSNSKRKSPQPENESYNSSDLNERPNKKQPKMGGTHDNTILTSIKKTLIKKPTNLDYNRRLSHRQDLVGYKKNPTTFEQVSNQTRHTINIDTNVAHHYGGRNQLETMVDMFNRTLENETDMLEIQAELHNIQNLRLDKEKSLAVMVETKTLNLGNKQTKIINLLQTIKEQEAELKMLYSNLFKKLENLARRIQRSKSKMNQQENEIDQIRQAESNLMKQLLKTITDRSDNIRDEIWKQYVIDLGRNIQQHFVNRYL